MFIKLMTKLITPQMVPKINTPWWTAFLVGDISSLNTLLYIYTGSKKAKAVQANAPDRLMNKPNLGIIIADMPVRITIADLRIIFLRYGLVLNGFELFVNQ